MARINLTLPDDLDKEFRDEVARRLGFKKGHIQIAIREAIEAWIRQSKKR